jgi:hypothetical protein
MVFQLALPLTVQLHPAPAITATLPEPPLAENDWLAGEIEKVVHVPA